MEIMEMKVALETYQMAYGHYPNDPNITERLGPNSAFDPVTYVSSSELLYRALSGKLEPDGIAFMASAPNMLRPTREGHVYIVDPMGNSYGYSTLKAAHPESADGENPTFDLWSTSGGKLREDKPLWVTNWQPSSPSPP